MTNEFEYTVTVEGYHAGSHRLIVRQSPSRKDCRYVIGEPFGVSRDYPVDSDEAAIRRLLGEHAAEVIDIRRKEATDE